MNTIARASGVLLAAGMSFMLASVIELPQGGDCRGFAAKGGQYWRGVFSGSAEDLFDHRWPVYEQACFASHFACNRWINEMLTATDQLMYMRCEERRG